ncbi:unnamed protein product [Rotaria sp. Silwood2]|nr:unnamed protein product [Rotaria sp. Silwood2]
MVVPIKTYFIGKRHLSHRITRKPPQVTLETAAAAAVAQEVSLSVPLNDSNNIPNQSETAVITSPLLEEVVQARRATVSEEEAPKDAENIENFENVNETLKYKDKPIIVDISVCILISLIVLYGISRQVEVARRSQDHIVHKSSEQRIEVEKKCDRVDWLLRNILPEHVIEVLCQLGGSYSRNHPCVGVLFASLINFHVLYEEQYEGEKFYSRILNEFYGDIEELFLDRRFLKIEKIKTIGSTFMAASGIQTDSNDQKPLGKIFYFIEKKTFLNKHFRMCFSVGVKTSRVITRVITFEL